MIFARHGESTANLSNTFANRGEGFPLTQAGIRQAEDLGGRCVDLRVSRLLTSPLLRARETAYIVATILGVRTEVRPELTEFDVGAWEGTSDREGWAEYARVTSAWAAGETEARTRGGESLAEVMTRFEPLGKELIEMAECGERVLCIGHGGTYRAALPGFFANVTHEFAAAQAFPHSAWILGEARDGAAFCTEWCGVRPPC
jgi:probable phosphoglycerate mutase